MDCGGRAQRRHRFRADYAQPSSHSFGAGESGVALRFPPHSKTLARGRWREN